MTLHIFHLGYPNGMNQSFQCSKKSTQLGVIFILFWKNQYDEVLGATLAAQIVVEI